MDDLQRTSETVVFMVYLGKWSDGGVVSSVDVLVVHESAVSNARLRFCFFALIEQEEPSRASFVLIFWNAFVLKSSGVFNYSLLLLPGQLDGAVAFNNCPGYSVFTWPSG